MKWKILSVGIIAVIIIILIVWLIQKEKFTSFEEVKKLIPKEALNCPHMRAKGLNLGDEKFMKGHWKVVRTAVESGHMPPAGFEHIWTEQQKQEFLKKLTAWGEGQA